MHSVDRRTFLALGLACLAAGCTNGGGPPLPWNDPDEAVRAEVVAAERSLIAAYRATIAAHPDLANLLEPLVAQHEQHLTRVDPSATSTTAGGTTTPSATATAEQTPGPHVPANPAKALAALADAAQAAYRQRVNACDTSHSGELAGDLCLIAASEAQQAAWLSRSSASTAKD